MPSYYIALPPWYRGDLYDLNSEGPCVRGVYGPDVQPMLTDNIR